MNKREICRFIEKIGGCFNTDLRLWIIKNKHSGLLMDYLKNNGIKYGRSKDGFFRIVTEQNHIIYVKAIRQYRKPIDKEYSVVWSSWNTEITTNGIKDYKALKEYISFLKRTNKKHGIDYLRIYAENREVCKSLWKGSD